MTGGPVVAGYKTVSVLSQGPIYTVMRATRIVDAIDVVLKFVPKHLLSSEIRDRMVGEFHCLQSLPEHLPVVRVLSLDEPRTGLALVCEDKDKHTSLDRQKISRASISVLSSQLTIIVGELHDAGLIHQRIDPTHVLWNENTQKLLLTGFSEASHLRRSRSARVHSDRLEYLAPEQTGRTNQLVDHRTDLYGIGSVLYYALVGRPPFENANTLNLLHSIIAVDVVPAIEANPLSPKNLSAICDKLLSKASEDRYQSARGLTHDLDHLDTLTTNTLGGADKPLRFMVSQKLRGRDIALSDILGVFERVEQGGTELLLITGGAGIGKSSLVSEIQGPIIERRAIYCEGKFDQLNQATPYAGLRQALSGLVKQLVTESGDVIARWKREINASLGNNLGVIAELVPELDVLIDGPTAYDALPPLEASNRIHLAFQQLFMVLSRPEHPLLMFLDDLQWADVASLALIHKLLQVEELTHLLVVGAFRDNEVSDEHPVRLELTSKSHSRVTEILLPPLDAESLSKLVADSLHCPGAQADELAGILQEKAAGNPFFTGQLLTSYVEQSAIEFSPELNYWVWDEFRVREADVADNVVDLLSLRIRTLPDAVSETLGCAALLGGQFDLELLTQVRDLKRAETLDHLQRCIDLGLLIGLKSTAAGESSGPVSKFKFVHDRVQQAAHGTQQEHIDGLNLRIGRILLQNYHPDTSHTDLYRMVDHLNGGVSCMPADEEISALVDLNLEAGISANLAGAFTSASKYLNCGILLEGRLGTVKYSQRIQSLYEHALGAAYHIGDLDAVTRLARYMLKQETDDLKKVDVLLIQIQAFFAEGMLPQGVRLARKAFVLLRLKFPKNIKQSHIILAYLRVKARLLGKSTQSLAQLPLAKDARTLKSMQLMSIAGVPVYSVEPDLLPLFVFRMVEISITRGNSEYSPNAYASFGMILCGAMGDLERGYQFGELAMTVLYKLNAKNHISNTLHWVNAFTRCWKDPVRTTLAPLLEGYRAGVASGDFQSAGYCLFTHDFHHFSAGGNLVTIEENMRTSSAILRQLGQEKTRLLNELNRQVVLNLIEPSENPTRICGSAYDDDEGLKLYLMEKDGPGEFTIYINRLILSCFFMDAEAAMEAACAAERLLDNVVGSLDFSFFPFYNAIAHALTASGMTGSERVTYTRKMKADLKKLQKCAEHAPENFLHRAKLIEAEIYKLDGKDEMARQCYDEATRTASESQYVHEEGLAYEMAARWALSNGREATARSYLLEAHYDYVNWGASSKVKDLESRYKEVLAGANLEHGSMSWQTSNNQSLDTLSIIEAAQAISSELVLENLLDRLLDIVIQTAGAQRAALFLRINEEPRLVAYAELDKIHMVQEGRLSAPEWLPTTVVNYCFNTLESVVLDDIAEEMRFQGLGAKTGSVLCLPLINQGQPGGILYAEHNTPGVFSRDRLEVLRVLTAQAAVSIENTTLYDQLQAAAITRNNLERFFPPETMGKILDGEVSLGAMETEVTVIFSDITKFTELSSTMTPTEIMELLNQYFPVMAEIVFSHGGVLEKYVGDAILAVWGAPSRQPDDADQALSAAIEMQRANREVNKNLPAHLQIETHIGINTGIVAAGNIGSDHFMQYVTIGDTTNVASRICSAAESGEILIAASTLKQLANPPEVVALPPVIVKGKEDALELYRVAWD